MPVQIDLTESSGDFEMHVIFSRNMLSFWDSSSVFRVSTSNWNCFLENMSLRWDAFFLRVMNQSVWAAQLCVQEAMMYVK